MKRTMHFSALTFSLLTIFNLFAADDKRVALENSTEPMVQIFLALQEKGFFDKDKHSNAGEDSPKINQIKQLPLILVNPPAPKPGDHILNPANRTELLNSIRKLEAENQQLTGYKRPDSSQMSEKIRRSTTLTESLMQTAESTVQSNMAKLHKLDKIKNWQPKKPTKKSWLSTWVNVPIIGYFCMDQEQKEIYNYNARKAEKNSINYPRCTLSQSHRYIVLNNQQEEFKKTPTYKKAIKQLPYLDQVAYSKKLREQAAYGYHIEMAVKEENIAPDKIVDFLNNDFQNRDIGYESIQPLADNPNSAVYIDYYLEQRRTCNDAKERKTNMERQWARDIDPKYQYALYMDDAIEHEKIAEDQVENFLKNNFVHKKIRHVRIGRLAQNTRADAQSTINKYLQIRKVYEKSEDRLKHFDHSFDKHSKIIDEVDAITHTYDKTVLLKHIAMHRGIDEKTEL